MDDHDDNIFDDDDALDYILYEDAEKDVREQKGGGCLGLLVILTSAAAISLFLLSFPCLF